MLQVEEGEETMMMTIRDVELGMVKHSDPRYHCKRVRSPVIHRRERKQDLSRI
jgi:hypothetical protein